MTVNPIKLAQLPTPLYRMNRLSDAWGADIWVKRDDLTGFELTGNKVRKLEYLLADAMNSGADNVITCGGFQSNHCRATAFAAAKLGIRCTLLLRGDTPAQSDGNHLLAQLTGAEIEYVSNERYYADLTAEFERISRAVASGGGVPFIIPEGGSNSIGCWGYVQAVREAMEQCGEAGCRPQRIICASGSGGTHAGLLVGTRLFGWEVEVISIAVCYDVMETTLRIEEIVGGIIGDWRLNLTISGVDIVVLEGCRGAGYARADKDVRNILLEVARLEGLILDPVYTGKAALGMKKEVESQNMNGSTLFWHTGGGFGLFGFVWD